MAWGRRLACAAVLLLVSSHTVAPSVFAAPLRRPTATPPPHGRMALATQTPLGSPISCVDARTGAPFQFHARHLFSSGQVDQDWTADPARLCLGSMDGQKQNVVPDGGGGAFVGWADSRSGETDIYLQRYVSAGGVAQGWPAGGLAVCRERLAQYGLDATADGAGGVYLTWTDFRHGGRGEIYATRITGAGAFAEGWPEGGTLVCADTSAQSAPRISADGGGGAYIVWQDTRRGSSELYASHLTATGARAEGWLPAGALLASSGDQAFAPVLASDGLGHTVAVWRTEGSGGMGLRSLALTSLIATQDTLAPASLSLVSDAGEISDPVVSACSDGSALVSWIERRDTTATVRAQRMILAAGVDPQWPVGGVVLSAAGPRRTPPSILSDGAGGGTIVWEDQRGGNADIYAQRILASGQIAEGWDSDGMPVCVADDDQYAPSIASDGLSGAIFTWSDDVSSALAGYVSLTPTGIGSHVQLISTQVRPGHAHIVWHVDHGTASALTVERRPKDGEWTALTTVAPDDSDRVIVDDRTAPDGQRLDYRLTLLSDDIAYHLPPVSLDIPRAPDRLTLHRAWLTQARNSIAASLALPRGAPARMELLDITGRRVAQQTLPGLDPGEQTVRLDSPIHLAQGIYFFRVSQGSQAQIARVVVLR